MKRHSELRQIAKQGLGIIKSEPRILEGVVYASANRRSVGRLVYTTHIPCNGFEEPKSDEDLGICVEIWFTKNGKRYIGMGHEPSDISLEAIRQALAKAKRDAVADRDFHGFFRPVKDRISNPRKTSFHDERLFSLSDSAEARLLSGIAWETIRGAVTELTLYARKRHASPEQLAFVLNGDNFIIREQMALATTNGIVESECSTIVLSFLTAMFEKEKSKGSSWKAQATLKRFSPFKIGQQAVRSAISGIGGVRVPEGNYPVIFGPQAVAELFGSLLLPHFTLSLVDFGASLYTGQYGKQVTSSLLSLYDDATIPLGAGSKRITCEGAPTQKKVLLDRGVLVGYLSDSRTRNKILARAKEATRKLGIDPSAIKQAISPQNGFRFAEGGGRVAGLPVGFHATNLVIDSPTLLSQRQLLKKVDRGLYIGRLWYTYPVGGYSTGIISGTVIADSYLIRGGKLVKPLLLNTLRLEDNLREMMQNIIGIAKPQVPTILWASDEIAYAPWVAIDNVNFTSISANSSLS